MKDYKVIYSDELRVLYEKDLIDGLNRHAFKNKGLKGIEPFSFIVLGSQEEFLAGVQGYMYHGCLDINFLFVKEEERGKGYGGLLLNKVTELANQCHCLFIILNTMDFEAKPFYEKYGFEVEFIRHGFAEDSVMYCMRKAL